MDDDEAIRKNILNEIEDVKKTIAIIESRIKKDGKFVTLTTENEKDFEQHEIHQKKLDKLNKKLMT